MPALSTFVDGDRLDYNGPNDFSANPAGQYVKSGTVALLYVSTSSVAVPTASQYTHTQAVAATQWTVAHGLGGEPDSVNVYVPDPDNVGQFMKAFADVEVVDNNNIVINFAKATTGRATIEL